MTNGSPSIIVMGSIQRRAYVRISEIILKKSIEALGHKGDIVRVPANIMRHQLHPDGSACYATEENIKSIFLPLARTGLPVKVFGIPIVHSALIPPEEPPSQ